MTAFVIGLAAVAACVLVLCLPTLCLAVVSGNVRTAVRLSVAVVVCSFVTTALGAYLAAAGVSGLVLVR